MDTATSSAKLPQRIGGPAFRWLQERGAIEIETARKDIRLPRAVLSPTPHSITLAYTIVVAYGVALEYFDELYAFVEQCADEDTNSATLSERERDTSVSPLAHWMRGQHEFTRPYLGGDTTVIQLKECILTCAKSLTTGDTLYEFPYISIVQSAGFGKSRLLRTTRRTIRRQR